MYSFIYLVACKSIILTDIRIIYFVPKHNNIILSLYTSSYKFKLKVHKICRCTILEYCNMYIIIVNQYENVTNKFWLFAVQREFVFEMLLNRLMEFKFI